MRIWLPAGVGFLGQALGMALVGIFGFFVFPLRDEFGVDVATINMGPALLLVIPALIGPLVGNFIDRVSIRTFMMCGVLVGMAGIYSISLMHSLWAIAACFLVFGVGLSMYGPVTINSLLVKIYRTQLGRALAIAAMGVSIGTIILPLCTAWLMEQYGWRGALQWLSIGIALILIPAIYLGLPGRIEPAQEPEQPESNPPMMGDYLRERAFWLIGLMVALVFNVSLVMTICYPAHFEQLEFTPTQAATFMAAAGLGGMTGKIIVALYVDRWRAKVRWITAGVLLLQALGFAMLLASEQYHTIICATTLVGLASGSILPLHPFLNNAYFPPEFIGRISGAQTPMMLPFGLIGAPLSGYVFDVTGSFVLVFVGLIGVILASILFLALLPRSSVEREGEQHGSEHAAEEAAH